MNVPARRPCRRRSAGWVLALVLGVMSLGPAACGDDPHEEGGASAATATPLVIRTSDAGSGIFEIDAPKRIRGGLVNLEYTNASAEIGAGSAQLLRIDGAHTPQEILVNLPSGDVAAPIPDWLHVAGGIGGTPSGQAVSATLNLSPGKYVVTDRGALAEFEVTAGENGPLPASTATFVATTGPKDSLEASALHVGKNRLRLVNRGKEMHQPFMVPIRPGKTMADVKRFFMEHDDASRLAPVDFERAVATAMVEGDTEQVVDFEPLGPAGKYVVVCFLADRDGQGGSHVHQGTLAEVDVK
jgi:hypothetical protein